MGVLRSLLFVPGDRPERIEKARGYGADALILDLEDSVSTVRKPQARHAVAEALAVPRSNIRIFVRINPLQGGLAEYDLAAICKARPDGIVLPKADGATALAQLDRLLTEAGDVAAGILPIAGETPLAMFQLGSYGGVTDRLCGLTWGAEDLSTSLGASTGRELDGSLTPPLELARSLTLFGARAAGVAAIDTVYPNFRDLGGLKLTAERAARDGFSGMLAIHPTQVPVINTAFSPDPQSVVHARAVVAAFASSPDAGVLSVNGVMVDAPHLKQAKIILARSGAPV